MFDFLLIRKKIYADLTGNRKNRRIKSLWDNKVIDLTQATLQEWAMKQGLDANISSMTQAEKTMLRYQYVMQAAQSAMGDFARTSDRMCVA